MNDKTQEVKIKLPATNVITELTRLFVAHTAKSMVGNFSDPKITVSTQKWKDLMDMLREGLEIMKQTPIPSEDIVELGIAYMLNYEPVWEIRIILKDSHQIITCPTTTAPLDDVFRSFVETYGGSFTNQFIAEYLVYAVDKGVAITHDERYGATVH